jgi:hypothetical protein
MLLANQSTKMWLNPGKRIDCGEELTTEVELVLAVAFLILDISLHQ